MARISHCVRGAWPWVLVQASFIVNHDESLRFTMNCSEALFPSSTQGLLAFGSRSLYLSQCLPVLLCPPCIPAPSVAGVTVRPLLYKCRTSFIMFVCLSVVVPKEGPIDTYMSLDIHRFIPIHKPIVRCVDTLGSSIKSTLTSSLPL